METNVETFFNMNIGIITENGWKNIFTAKGPKITNKFLVFKKKPKNFDNFLLLAESKDNFFYLRYSLEEILPFLSEEDCAVKLPLDQIFKKYGKTNVTEITEANVDILENDLKRGFN